MNDDLKHAHDRRQYQLMIEQLSLFNEERLSLGLLLSRLKGLASTLELASPSWKDEFTNQWGTLEIVYAMALNRAESAGDSHSETILSKKEHSLVLTSIKNLQRLIRKRICHPT
ncbi:hypothetical protein AB4Z52_10535 [Rhizobium sp. 2YAF20]|uniref:hypothetical protein n=1 Tax=Rhizobium sp. 2YAF20 TaxID=3233027 RepID=UPI003F966DD9